MILRLNRYSGDLYHSKACPGEGICQVLHDKPNLRMFLARHEISSGRIFMENYFA